MGARHIDPESYFTPEQKTYLHAKLAQPGGESMYGKIVLAQVTRVVFRSMLDLLNANGVQEHSEGAIAGAIRPIQTVQVPLDKYWYTNFDFGVNRRQSAAELKMTSVYAVRLETKVAFGTDAGADLARLIEDADINDRREFTAETLNDNYDNPIWTPYSHTLEEDPLVLASIVAELHSRLPKPFNLQSN